MVLLTMAMLASGVAACGGASGDPSSSSSADRSAATTGGTTQTNTHAKLPAGYWKSDGDEDLDEQENGPSKDDKGGMVASGHGASPADKNAISAVVRRYLQAGTAGDGAEGCSLLAASLSGALAEQESQLPSRSAGVTCAAALSRLFNEEHARLLAEGFATMVVTGVHVDGPMALATLGFRTAHESEIVLRREHGVWKIDALSDSTLP